MQLGLVEISIVLAGVMIVVGIIVPAIGQARSVAGAMEGIARQPEAAGPIGNNLIIGLAFIESLSIYVLVISLIIMFVFAYPSTQDLQKVSAAQAEVQVLELQIKQIELQRQLEELTPAP